MTLQHISQFLDKPTSSDDTSNQASPFNASTGLAYQGNNVAILIEAASAHKYTSTQWATLRQWNILNERVRKGEKGTAISYFDTQIKIVEDKTEKIPFRKRAYVFNRCQLQSFQPEQQQ